MHDFANSRYVMLWGMNNLGANQGLWESRALIEAKKKGARLVVVDPNFTETAQKANEWVPIRPGTDGAMALAMCRVIIDEDLYDRDFVSRYCEGFDGFRDHLREKGYTPAWAEAHLRHRRGHHHPARARIRPDQAFDVRDLQGLGLLHERRRRGARLLHPQRPLWRGGQAGQPEPEGLGAAGRAGRTSPTRPRRSRASRRCTSRWATRSRPDLPNSRLPDAVIDGKPYPVKGLFVQSTNPVMSDPNRDRVQEMFRHLELGVAIELFMSETALECDIVLPETSFYEHAEIRNGMWLGPEVVLCQPAVAPVGEAKPLVRDREGASPRRWAGRSTFPTRSGRTGASS